jgi:hypothetical protein
MTTPMPQTSMGKTGQKKPPDEVTNHTSTITALTSV